MLRIRVIGGVRADVDGAELDLASASRARGLLAWLAVHPGTHARSVLAARLRPDVPDESARKSLRQAAWSLRAALGDAGGLLVGDRERLGLSDDPALVAVDLAEFRRRRDAGDPAGAVEAGEGELLAGLDEEWAPALREAHREEVIALIGRLADEADARGAPPPPARGSRPRRPPPARGATARAGRRRRRGRPPGRPRGPAAR